MAVLTRMEVEALARRHFGDLGEEAVGIATAIAYAESGWNTEAVGDNYASGHQAADSPYRWDRGIMQINSVHGYDPIAIMDPDQNMAEARDIYNRQGWGAWSTWRFGQAQQFYQYPTPVPVVVPEPSSEVLNVDVHEMPFTQFNGQDRDRFIQNVYRTAYGYSGGAILRDLPDGPEGQKRYFVELPTG